MKHTYSVMGTLLMLLLIYTTFINQGKLNKASFTSNNHIIILLCWPNIIVHAIYIIKLWLKCQLVFDQAPSFIVLSKDLKVWLVTNNMQMAKGLIRKREKVQVLDLS